MQNVPKNTSLPVTSTVTKIIECNYPYETKEIPYSELEKSIINNLNNLPNTLDYADDECDTPIYVETKEEIPPLLEPLLPDECYNSLKEIVSFTFGKCINPTN